MGGASSHLQCGRTSEEDTHKHVFARVCLYLDKSIHYIALHYTTLHYITLHYITIYIYIYVCVYVYIYIYYKLIHTIHILTRTHKMCSQARRCRVLSRQSRKIQSPCLTQMAEDVHPRSQEVRQAAARRLWNGRYLHIGLLRLPRLSSSTPDAGQHNQAPDHCGCERKPGVRGRPVIVGVFELLGSRGAFL